MLIKKTNEDSIAELDKHKRDLANNSLEGGEVSGQISFEDKPGAD
jgi:hypothetical protein